MTIGKRIKHLRDVLNINQTEFGKRIGISNPAVSKIENGITNPAERTIKLICSEFGISREWLTTGSGQIFASDNVVSVESFSKELSEKIVNYPDLLNEMSKAIKIMTDDDWKNLNYFVQRFVTK